MNLDHIELTNLRLSPLNVRKNGIKHSDNLVVSIANMGLLQPLLVRANDSGSSGEDFEIIAGQRRFNACQTLEAEGNGIGAVPCIIMQDGDDAAAIEASLAENIARLPMDEIDQYQAFSALLEQGRSIDDIASHFGVTQRLVQQRLAISNLFNPILKAYRNEDIKPSTLRILTMATTRQQKAWWKLHKDEQSYAPLGNSLKSWLFGGQHIPTENALFNLDDYTGGIVSDLFGEEKYFTDSEKFWTLQGKSIALAKEKYMAEGWTEIVLEETGEHWCSWEYVETAKEDGGRIYVSCSSDGEVCFHEGFLTRKEAERLERQNSGNKKSVVRPEITKAMQNYLDLHRHCAVKIELLKHPDIALRLSVAHMICGSGLWKVEAEPQRGNTEAIRESISISPCDHRFHDETRDIRDILSLEADQDIIDHSWHGHDLAETFARLTRLDNDEVMRILTFVMAESLQSATSMVEGLGQLLNVNMADHWQVSSASGDVFFDLLRDKQAINAIVAELAGKSAADANLKATAKVQKGIIKDCLNGTRKAEVENWQPRYMQFPMKAYTNKGGIAAMDGWQEVKGYSH